MSAVVISGDTSGSVTLQAPAVSGNTTLNLPAINGTVLNDATVGVCRAWVNFNGSGTVAIRASFNVTSITDNGTGDYTVNFTNALSDTNYSVVMASSVDGNYNQTGVVQASLTSSAARVRTLTGTGAAADSNGVYVAIFR